MIEFCCPNCNKRFSVPETAAGKKGKCPQCKNIIVIPSETLNEPDILATIKPAEPELRLAEPEQVTTTPPQKIATASSSSYGFRDPETPLS